MRSSILPAAHSEIDVFVDEVVEDAADRNSNADPIPNRLIPDAIRVTEIVPVCTSPAIVSEEGVGDRIGREYHTTLLFDDPTRVSLIDREQWNEYLSSTVLRVYQQSDGLTGTIYKALKNDAHA